LVYRTAFPTLSRAQEDLDRLRASSLRMVSLIAAFAFPVAAGLYLVNQSFILALFGDRWAEASPVLKILCPAGGLWALSAVTGPILLARGRAGTWLALNLLSIPTATTLLLLGIPYGPEGAALGMMAYALARGLGNFACALRTLQASWIHLARELWAPFLSSITMVLVVQEGQRWVDPVSAPWLHLAVTVPAGAVVFVLALLVLGKRQLMGMIHSIHTLSVGTAPPLTSAPTPS
jgi:O-antigen/teichoic acid export membrane protein